MASQTKGGRGRSRARAQRPTAVEQPPDVLGTDGRVDVLVGLLRGIHQQRFRVQAAQVANGDGDDDPVAGIPPREDGTVNSYKVVLAGLAEQEKRLEAEYPKEMGRVRELMAS